MMTYFIKASRDIKYRPLIIALPQCKLRHISGACAVYQTLGHRASPVTYWLAADRARAGGYPQKDVRLNFFYV